jgi:L-alanine-DL-glutamate epimerase-like enolase superfamily enzyme
MVPCRAVKITDVNALHLPGSRYPWVFLHIETDTGIRGLGQVSSGPNSAMVAVAVPTGARAAAGGVHHGLGH